MKSLKAILGIALATAGIGGAVAVGATTISGAENNHVQMAEAATNDIYYLTGSFNGWSTDASKCVKFESHTGNEVRIFGIEFTGNNTFKALKQTGGSGSLSWQGDITGTGNGNNQIESASGINTYAYGNNGGIHYKNDSSTNHFNMYYDFSKNHFYVDYTYKLQIGSVTTYMGANPGNDSEIYGTADGTVAGSGVTVTYFNDATPGTFNLGTNDKPSNNLSSNKTIKVGGTVSFYMKKSNWSDAWATGYSPATDVDGALENFCNSILTNTINNSKCNVSNWSAVESSWNNVKNNATLVSAFNSASVSYGPSASYSSVVCEARTRFGYLHQAFGVTLSGATIPSASAVINIIDTSNNNFGVLVAVIATIVGGSGLAYFLLRKKKFN